MNKGLIESAGQGSTFEGFLHTDLYQGWFSTHKLHAAVIGEKLLHADAPVLSGDQRSVGSVSLTQVADPRVLQLQRIKRSRPDEDVQTVLAVRPEGGEQRLRTENGLSHAAETLKEAENLQQPSLPHSRTSIP